MQSLSGQDPKPCDPTLFDPLSVPQALQSTPAWLLWTPVFVPKKNKYLKKPVHGNYWQNHLSTFTDVIKARAQSPSTLGIGFAYTTDHPFICVDLDNLTDDNLSLATSLDSYTEISPSGEGYHIIIETDNKNALIEVFQNGKRSKAKERDLFIAIGFVTLTNRLPPSSPVPKPVRFIPAEELIPLLAIYFSHKEDTSKTVALDPAPPQAKTTPAFTPLSVAQCSSLLAKLPVVQLTSDIFDRLRNNKSVLLDPECTEESREGWLAVGQALHHNFKGSLKGFILWSEWSKMGTKYDDQDAESVWQSFKSLGQPITVATLIKLADRQCADYPHLTAKKLIMGTIQNFRVYLQFNKISVITNELSKQVAVSIPPNKEKQWGIKTYGLGLDTLSNLINSDFQNMPCVPGSFKPTQLKHYLKAEANSAFCNPIREYFENCGQTWDGRDYISALMATITPSLYPGLYKKTYKLFLRKWLLQVAAAACHLPEDRARMNRVLIFQGEQNTGKTMWVQSLFPKELQKFCSADKDLKLGKYKVESTKLAMELATTLICNINEIDKLFKDSSYSEFKSFLDQTTDNIVLPYGETPVEMPRRTVFIGSTNLKAFLVDHTGNRRIEIIPVEHLNYKHTVPIDQLWGQVYNLYISGEKWWLDEDSPDPVELQAIKDRDRINNLYMAFKNEAMAYELDDYFNAAAPLSEWKKFTLKDIRALMGISSSAPRSSLTAIFKDTLTTWLAQIPDAPPTEKGAGPRPRVYYWMPPLRSGDESFPTAAFEAKIEQEQPLQ